MKNPLLLICVSISIVLVTVFAIYALWPGLSLSVQPLNVMSVMAPLLLTAGFIERAVEAVISPWRDPGADERTTALARLKADPTASPAQMAVASNALDAYKGTTKQYAFTIALVLGLAAAIVGVRALWPFLDAQAMSIFTKASKTQQATFIVVDVVLSTALLAGGANGIHSVVNAFTSFFNTTAQMTQQQSATP